MIVRNELEQESSKNCCYCCFLADFSKLAFYVKRCYLIMHKRVHKQSMLCGKLLFLLEK